MSATTDGGKPVAATESGAEAASMQYTSGQYWEQHSEWMENKTSLKAKEVVPGLRAVLDQCKSSPVRFADVGCGTGAVVANAAELIAKERPGVAFELSGFDIAANAIQRGRELFPNVKLHCKLFEPSDGPFDVVLLADVYEHLENPWELMRQVHAASEFMLVRQPLLQSLNLYRRNAYRAQRENLGHIAMFTYHQFVDMAAATGWKPVHLELLPPWEQAAWGDKKKKRLLPGLFTDMNRTLASAVISGFYLNGAFRRA